jgi:hypothetical protein
MTPNELARVSEHGNQRAVFAWANCAALYGFEYANDDLAYSLATRESLGWKYGNPYPIPPLMWLYAVHNQGHGDKIRGGRAKAEGVKSGVPDMCLPYPFGGYAGAYIELKQEKYRNRANGGRSEKQDEWIAYLAEVGYFVRTAYGWREATQYLTEYLRPAR